MSESKVRVNSPSSRKEARGCNRGVFFPQARSRAFRLVQWSLMIERARVLPHEVEKWPDFSNGELESLFGLPAAHDTLEQAEAIAYVNYKTYNHGVRDELDHEIPAELDVAFLSVSYPRSVLDGVGVPLFGFPKCIGVGICTEGGYLAKEQELLRHTHLAKYLQNGEDVAIMLASDVPLWGWFYHQVSKIGLYERMGSEAFELSGLTRASTKFHRRITESLYGILDQNAAYLASCGVENIFHSDEGRLAVLPFVPGIDPDAALDVPFLKADRQTTAFVPLYHLRSAELSGPILVETVHSEPKLVPGFIVTKVGESKREAYQRARQAQAYYQRMWPEHREDIFVPLFSEGQARLFRKLGLTDILRASQREDDYQLEAEDLVRFLYLGDNNLRLAPLAARGFSLPGHMGPLLGMDTGEEKSGIDILFFKRDLHDTPRITVLDEEIYGLDMAAYKRGQRDRNGNVKLKAVGNVVGMSIVPSHWSADEIKAHSKQLEGHVSKHFIGTQIVCVTPELFAAWVEKGTPFVEKKVDEPDEIPIPITQNPLRQALRSAIEYGTTSAASQIYYVRLQGKAAVGGAKTFIVEKTPDGLLIHAIDFGAEFDLEHKAYGDLAAKPGTALGIRPQLESGRYPMFPGLYEMEYLLKTAIRFDRLRFNDEGDYIASYIRSEIYHRLDETEIRDFFDQHDPTLGERILMYGPEDEQRWYRGEDSILASILIPHAHADHNGDKPVLDHAAKEYVSHETIAMERAADTFGQTWDRKQTYIQAIAHDMIDGAYEKIPRPLIPIWKNGQIVYLSRNLHYEAHFTGHSLPGSLGQRFFSPRMGMNEGLLRTGDVRLDDAGDTEKMVAHFAGRGHILTIEATNGPSTEKPGAGKSESEVARSIERVLQDNPDSVVVIAAPKNHPLRLEQIMKAADAAGRKVALDYKHIVVNNSRRYEKSQISLGADGYHIPVWNFGTEVGLWAKPQEKPEPYQQSLLKIANNTPLGFVDTRRLSEEGNKWVLVISPAEFLSHLVGNAYMKKFVYIYSSYYPYQDKDKMIMGANYQWVYHRYGSHAHYSDYTIQGDGESCVVKPIRRDPTLLFHVSGHATFTQMVDSIIMPLLDGKYKGKHLVIEHTADPEVWKRAFLERMKPQELMERELHDTVNFLKKRVGLHRAEELRIHSHLRNYNPHMPLSNNPADVLGITGFKLRID